MVVIWSRSHHSYVTIPSQHFTDTCKYFLLIEMMKNPIQFLRSELSLVWTRAAVLIGSSDFVIKLFFFITGMFDYSI